MFHNVHPVILQRKELSMRKVGVPAILVSMMTQLTFYVQVIILRNIFIKPAIPTVRHVSLQASIVYFAMITRIVLSIR